MLERKVNLDLFVSNAQNISVEMDESLIYVSKNEYDEKMAQIDEDLENKAKKKKTYNVQVDTEGWSDTAPFTKTIAVNGILATDTVDMDIIWGNTKEIRKTESDEYNKIRKVDSINNGIILTCDEETPETTLNLRIEVIY